jgi:hypothetical protein
VLSRLAKLSSLFDLLDVFEQCALATSAETIPAALKSRDKNNPLALFRKAFNTLCRVERLGRVCAGSVLQGDCKCFAPRDKSKPPSPFVHAPLCQQFGGRVLKDIVKEFLIAHTPPEDYPLRPELAASKE